uniref:Transmembrane protein n=1 Tax=Panagrellus redivivus TaxID=6233 RepID=A0A7E4UXK5_PANRE
MVLMAVRGLVGGYQANFNLHNCSPVATNGCANHQSVLSPKTEHRPLQLSEMQPIKVFLLFATLSYFIVDVQAVKCYVKSSFDKEADQINGFQYCQSKIDSDGDVTQTGILLKGLLYENKECTEVGFDFVKKCDTDLCNTPCQEEYDASKSSSPKSTSSAYILISTVVMILGLQ